MSRVRPFFWSNPLRYLQWSAREKPAYFYSVLIGAIGPVLVFTVPPIRRRLGDKDRPQIPQTYPIPPGPRKIPEGYDDP